MDIFAGFSEDGIHWDIEETPIIFEGADEEILKREYRYDPRVCFVDDKRGYLRMAVDEDRGRTSANRDGRRVASVLSWGIK